MIIIISTDILQMKKLKYEGKSEFPELAEYNVFQAALKSIGINFSISPSQHTVNWYLNRFACEYRRICIHYWQDWYRKILGLCCLTTGGIQETKKSPTGIVLLVVTLHSLVL